MKPADTNKEKPIAPGDIVYLLSGGPPMTVGEVSHQSAECLWFSGGEVRRHHFLLEALTFTRAGSLLT